MDTARGFRAPVAARIVGLRYHQLDYYDRKGLVRPSLGSAKGHGSRRVYSFADLVGLRVIREMLDQGLSVQRIRKAVAVLRREWSKAGDLGTGARIVTDGKGAWLAGRATSGTPSKLPSSAIPGTNRSSRSAVPTGERLAIMKKRNRPGPIGCASKVSIQR